MSVGLPSDEVAEDYKNSLEDLTINSRYEISNLTVIAKENTEHALAISRVLETHIKNTPPDRKLPALYVLDSVVKNVGTPYTLFLGRNLYNIFMGAYSLVNNQVRRKLDEMLKTWKEPVPGSLDPRPVFPIETTRPIENALIKARTAAIQQQHQQQIRSQQEMLPRGRPMPTPNTSWRNTPTPPQLNGQFRPPVQGFTPQGYPPQYMMNGQHQTHSPYPQHPQYPPPQPTPQAFQQPPYQPPISYPHYQSNNDHLDTLHRDVEHLIRTTKDDFAANPYDTSIQTRLKALLDLQSIMTREQIPPDQIRLIRDQVDALSATPRLTMASSTPPQYALSPPQQVPPAQQSTPKPTDLQALFSSNNLADIIAKAQQGSSTPPVTNTPLVQGQSHTAPSLTASLAGGQSSLIASLRASGILPAESHTPTNGVLAPTPQPLPPYGTPPRQFAGLARPGLNNDVELTSVSLKIPRPHLISLLYEARPNQCSTCGRRFLATDEGRQKKARHLDWHFRTNQRLVDSAKRGQSRSWYVDELEWIKSRDDPEALPDDPSTLSATTKAALAASLTAADPKNKHIPVPSDQTLAKLPCPICQEKFDTVWSDDVQDFVWMDAVKIGSRVYHASCHKEVKREGGSTPGRTGTPDSVLGKRKAVDILGYGNTKAVKA